MKGEKPLQLTIDATLSNFDKATAPIVAPAAGRRDDARPVRAADRLGHGPQPADTALLQKVVLKPAQVGAGYKLSQMPGGHEVQNEVTLDFCDATLPERGAANRPSAGPVRRGRQRIPRVERGRHVPAGRRQTGAGRGHPRSRRLPERHRQEPACRRHEPGAAHPRRRRLQAAAGQHRDPRDRQRRGQGQVDDLDHDGRLPDPRQRPSGVYGFGTSAGSVADRTRCARPSRAPRTSRNTTRAPRGGQRERGEREAERRVAPSVELPKAR